MNNQDKKPLTRTPQELVHIKHSISARQYKYWFLLLKVYKELIETNTQADKDGFYSVSLSNISNLMGYELVKKELKSDLEALRQQPIIINYLEKDGKPVTHGMGFISEWKVSSTKISFKLPSFIEKVLQGDLEAKQMFLLLNWDIFNSFGGKYEAIIYKLCKDYIGVGRTPYFTVEEYRDYIGLKENEYKQFFRLNEWTLTKPIKNINNNEMSDILVKVVLEKKGVKVVGLHFEMGYKDNTPVLEIAPFEPNPAFEKSLITIPPNKQLEYLKNFSEDQIKAIIDYVNTQNEKGNIKNLSGYYNQAFINGWGLENWEAEQKAKAEEEERKRQAETKRKAELKAEQVEKARQKREKEEIEKCLKIFENLPQDEQEKILDEIENQTPPFMQKWFKNDRKDGNNPCRRPPFNFGLRDIIKERYVIEK